MWVRQFCLERWNQRGYKLSCIHPWHPVKDPALTNRSALLECQGAPQSSWAQSLSDPESGRIKKSCLFLIHGQERCAWYWNGDLWYYPFPLLQEHHSDLHWVFSISLRNISHLMELWSQLFCRLISALLTLIPHFWDCPSPSQHLQPCMGCYMKIEFPEIASPSAERHSYSKLAHMGYF